MITLRIAVDVLTDLTIVHSRAPGDPRASHCGILSFIGNGYHWIYKLSSLVIFILAIICKDLRSSRKISKVFV